VCALRIEDVVETMRPLPVASLAGVPPFVAGVAIARGEAAPVVNLDAVLGGDAPAAPDRFVLVRAGGRRALLAVDGVLGVAELAAGDAAPPLLAAAAGGAVDGLAALDRELMLVLRAGRLVPEEAWKALPGAGAGA
jgi:purine-binding chemotaxis protein CheW